MLCIVLNSVDFLQIRDWDLLLGFMLPKSKSHNATHSHQSLASLMVSNPECAKANVWEQIRQYVKFIKRWNNKVRSHHTSGRWLKSIFRPKRYILKSLCKQLLTTLNLLTMMSAVMYQDWFSWKKSASMFFFNLIFSAQAVSQSQVAQASHHHHWFP